MAASLVHGRLLLFLLIDHRLRFFDLPVWAAVLFFITKKKIAKLMPAKQ